jgi:hypothetical protein
MRKGVRGQDPSGGQPWLPSLKITQYVHILVSIRVFARGVTKTAGPGPFLLGLSISPPPFPLPSPPPPPPLPTPVSLLPSLPNLHHSLLPPTTLQTHLHTTHLTRTRARAATTSALVQRASWCCQTWLLTPCCCISTPRCPHSYSYPASQREAQATMLSLGPLHPI